MNDQQLREQFEAWAEPLRAAAPPAIGVIRRRARRRVAVLAAAGGSALAVAGLLVGLGISGWPGLAAAGSGTDVARPAAPGQVVTARHPFPPADPFLVTLDQAGNRATVRSEAGGKVLRVLTPPASGGQFTWVAAAASDRLFVLAEQQDRTDAAQFYALRLGPGGQFRSLRLVPGAGGLTGQIYGLAVSPDGTEFAVATTPRVPTSPSTARVWVGGLTRSRPAQTWSSTVGSASTLSFAGDDQLALYWQDTSQDSRSGLRILNVAPHLNVASDPGGGSEPSLPGASRLAVPNQNNSGSAQITADGSTVLTAVAEGSSGAAAVRVRLGEFSAASGRLVRWLPLTGQGTGTTYCGVLWSSRTGSTLITQCGQVQQAITGGKVTRIHLPMIIGAGMVGWQNTFAW
jgi:hypothetical protein